MFWFYLPLARTRARTSARYPHDPDDANQTVEPGLAQAVLARDTRPVRDSTGPPAPRSSANYGEATTSHPPRRDPTRPRTGAHHPIDD